MNFRPLQKTDYLRCCQIMEPTWKWETYFPFVRNIHLITSLLFDCYRRHSTYTEIAYDDDGTILGSLIAGNFDTLSFPRQFGIIIRFAFQTIRYGSGWFLLVSTAYNVLHGYVHADRSLKRGYSGGSEIHYLFTAPESRGQHVGSNLLSRYIDYARRTHIKTIRLVTDSDCNYGFYEHYGFVCLRTQNTILGSIPDNRKHNAPSSACFLYQYDICPKNQ